MTVMTGIRNIRSGENRVIHDHLFVYYPGVIEVWHEGARLDVMYFEFDEVTTTLHFEEKAMWWLHDWNRI